jgi:hypothetical protein
MRNKKRQVESRKAWENWGKEIVRRTKRIRGECKKSLKTD